LAVVLAMILPMAVSADNTGTAGVTGDVPPTPTLDHLSQTSETPNTVLNGASKTVSETLTSTGTDFEQGAAYSVNIGSANGVTVDNVVWHTTATITADLHIPAGCAAGDRTISITESGRTSGTKTFTVNNYISISAPSAISLGVMTIGVAKTGQSGTGGTVDANQTGATVTAKDANQGANTGHMLSSGNPLTNAFQIGPSGGTLTTADTGFSYAASATSLPFYVSQTALTDDAAGTYSITITFTGVY
jgi:hypothetical protein